MPLSFPTPRELQEQTCAMDKYSKPSIMSAANYPLIWYHIPEDWRHQLHYCKSLEIHKYELDHRLKTSMF
jgi:hypothetical protein